MNTLHYYPNMTQGGMGTVLRTRAINSPNDSFNLVFTNDRGGGGIYDELHNVDVRLVRKNRIDHYLTFIVNDRDYDEIIFTSAPETANLIFDDLPRALRVYEFHSSDIRVLNSEIKSLDLRRVDEIRVPSEYLASVVNSLVPAVTRRLIQVAPNEVDENIFFKGAPTEIDTPLEITLVWVGQFSRAKGYHDFLRLLGTLPKEYSGEMYFSGPVGNTSIVDLMAEVARSDVDGRISILYNVPQRELADRYRALGRSGIFVSTSLMESFGYGVFEALKCGIRCAAYDLPALRGFEREYTHQLQFAPLGEIGYLASAIREMRHK